jgi:hypothetical protein
VERLSYLPREEKAEKGGNPMQGAGTTIGRRIVLLIVVAAILTLMMAFGLSHLSGAELAGGENWSG